MVTLVRCAKNVFLCKQVLFQGRDVTAPHLRGHILKTSLIARIPLGIFNQTRKISTLAYY